MLRVMLLLIVCTACNQDPLYTCRYPDDTGPSMDVDFHTDVKGD